MGSSSSKAARTAGNTVARKYPTKASPATQAASAPSVSSRPQQPRAVGPTVHTTDGPRENRDQVINEDASDPNLASRLRQVGPVEANPYQSHTSTQYQQPSARDQAALHAQLAPYGNEPPPGLFPDPATMRNNPALLVMQARKRWQEKAEQEIENVGRAGFAGREMMDAGLVTEALKMRQRGVPIEDIEKRLGLKSGIMAKLGERGVLEPGYT